MNAQLEHLLSRLENVVASPFVLGKVYTLAGGKRGIFMYRCINEQDRFVFGLNTPYKINTFLNSSSNDDVSNWWMVCLISDVLGEDADQTLQRDPDAPGFKECVDYFKSADRPPKAK